MDTKSENQALFPVVELRTFLPILCLSLLPFKLKMLHQEKENQYENIAQVIFFPVVLQCETEHSWFLKAFSALGLFQRQSLAFTEPRSQFLTHLATGCKGGVQRSRATLCPEVNQHLWPSPHPGDCPSDGPLHSRHILPQRKGFGTCPHKATRTMTSPKAQQVQHQKGAQGLQSLHFHRVPTTCSALR